MQVPAPDAVLPLAPVATGPVVARVTAGNLASVPVGSLLAATVTQGGPREAVLTVNGQQLTVRPGNGVQLQAGAVLLVRVPTAATANPTLELVGRAPTQPQTATPQTAPAQNATPQAPPGAAPAAARSTTPAAPEPVVLSTTAFAQPRAALVDVLAVLPDGRLRIKVDGAEDVATSAEKLAPGGRYVAQVVRTADGLSLRSAADAPKLPADVATTILRGTRVPDLGATLKPLMAELTALQTPTPPDGTPPQPAAVREAAAAVRETLSTIMPDDGRPPNTAELKNLVDRGGLHFEAKLARLVDDAAAPVRVAPERGDPAARQPERGLVGPDLKGDLLRLLHAARELGGLTNAPAVAATLDGIENLQAANVLAQNEGSPYFLQVPFPDGDRWQTLHLGIEPEPGGNEPDAADSRAFRMLMHIPLNDLGETWVDAGLSGDRFCAVLYLGQAGTRDRVRAELPALRDELLGEGFGEVLLDVRSTADLPAKQRRQGAAMRSARPESVSVLDVKV